MAYGDKKATIRRDGYIIHAGYRIVYHEDWVSKYELKLGEKEKSQNSILKLWMRQSIKPF